MRKQRGQKKYKQISCASAQIKRRKADSSEKKKNQKQQKRLDTFKIARRLGEETRRRVAGGESRKLKLKQAENSNLFTL